MCVCARMSVCVCGIHCKEFHTLSNTSVVLNFHLSVGELSYTRLLFCFLYTGLGLNTRAHDLCESRG